MATFTYHPHDVCSREMIFEHDNGIIVSAKVIGGCQGNLQGICRLIQGMEIKKVVSLLKGIKCRGSRSGQTSCPDQIAEGLASLLH